MLLSKTLKEERPDTPIHVDGHEAYGVPTGVVPRRVVFVPDPPVTPKAKIISLSVPPTMKRTPEIDKWLADTESKLNAEAERLLINLLVFGTTHPEVDAHAR